MATSTLQIRIDEDLKNQASALFENIGIDIPTAVRIFFKKSVSDGGIPFSLKENTVRRNGLSAFYALRSQARAEGLSELSEDEIEKEISATRTARKNAAK